MITKYIESFAKYAGVATIGIEWLALLLYYMQLPLYFGGKYPISYFATFPQTRLIFSICYTLAGICFWIFVRYHLHKKYGAPLKIFTLSMVLFICLALFPFNPNNSFSSFIHDFLAWSGGILVGISMYIIARNSNNQLIQWITIITVILSMLFTVAFITSSKNSHFVFILEAGSWLVWQIWVLWISYYSYTHKVI